MIARFFLCLDFAPAVLAAELKEEAVTHAGVGFRVVKLNARLIELVWKDPQGEAYRTFDRVQAYPKKYQAYYKLTLRKPSATLPSSKLLFR